MSGVHGTGGVGAPGGVGATDPSGPIDIETLLMSVQIERAKNLDGQLAMQAQDIKNRNDLVAQYNKAMSDLRAVRPKDSGSVDITKALKDTLSALGIKLQAGTDGKSSGAQIDLMLNDAKDAVDKANSSNQMDMIRLQSLMNKRNEFFDMLTNFIEKFSKQQSNIVGNMR